ncbi:MAG TPA: hypothetical protein PKD55_00020 [Bellilinea sp.]|nr:hypothetical protein [Bellilinea sp.]
MSNGPIPGKRTKVRAGEYVYTDSGGHLWQIYRQPAVPAGHEGAWVVRTLSPDVPQEAYWVLTLLHGIWVAEGIARAREEARAEGKRVL